MLSIISLFIFYFYESYLFLQLYRVNLRFAKTIRLSGRKKLKMLSRNKINNDTRFLENIDKGDCPI